MNRGNLLTFGLVLTVLCPLCLFINHEQFEGAATSPAAFDKTTGTITLSQVDTWRRRKRPWGKETVYDFDIRYKYTVGTKHFEARRVFFDLSSIHTTPDFARSYTRKYPLGKRVAVFYRRDDAAFAVLEPANKGRAPLVFWIVAGLWVSGVLLVIFNFRKKLRGNR